MYFLPFSFKHCLKISLTDSCQWSSLCLYGIPSYGCYTVDWSTPSLTNELRLFPIFYSHTQRCKDIFPTQVGVPVKHLQYQFPQVELLYPRVWAFPIFLRIAKLPSKEVIPQIPFFKVHFFSHYKSNLLVEFLRVIWLHLVTKIFSSRT